MKIKRRICSMGTAIRGYVYAIGTAYFEPGQEFFRRTAMDVPEYAGDVPENAGGGSKDPGNDSRKTDPNRPVSPLTGEESRLPLWILLLLVFAGGTAVAGAAFRKDPNRRVK